jgi:hypothetical protein
MGTDVASIALLFTGSGASLGGVGFFVAPPVIHGVHGNTSMAIASPLMRMGLPLVGGAIGASAASCSSSDEDSWCELGGALAGLGIGLLTAMIVDYSLAWEDRAVPARMAQAPTPPHRPPRFSLTTAGVAPIADGASLVLGGRF